MPHPLTMASLLDQVREAANPDLVRTVHGLIGATLPSPPAQASPRPFRRWCEADGGALTGVIFSSRARTAQLGPEPTSTL